MKYFLLLTGLYSAAALGAEAPERDGVNVTNAVTGTLSVGALVAGPLSLASPLSVRKREVLPLVRNQRSLEIEMQFLEEKMRVQPEIEARSYAKFLREEMAEADRVYEKNSVPSVIKYRQEKFALEKEISELKGLKKSRIERKIAGTGLELWDPKAKEIVDKDASVIHYRQLILDLEVKISSLRKPTAAAYLKQKPVDLLHDEAIYAAGKKYQKVAPRAALDALRSRYDAVSEQIRAEKDLLEIAREKVIHKSIGSVLLTTAGIASAGMVTVIGYKVDPGVMVDSRGFYKIAPVADGDADDDTDLAVSTDGK